VADDQDGAARRSLLGRIRSITRDLYAAEAHLRRIDEVLRRRVAMRMGTRIAGASRTATALARTAGRDAADLAPLWSEVHALRCEVDALLEECLLLVSGAAQRSLGFDGGYCELADTLVDELVARTPVGHWGSFTVVGRAEQYSRASRVIQLRFPATTVWDLPAVAHELGHFVGPALVEDSGFRSEHPLDLLYAELGDGSDRSWSWLQELFADAFAAHLVGPAYGFLCVQAAFDPLLAHLPTATHPAAGQRVHIIAAMLATGDDEDRAWAAKQTVALWDRLVDAAGGAEGRDPVGASPYAGPLVELIDDHLPISGYAGWAAAEAVAAVLAEPRPVRPAGVAVTDILNGAWLARLRSGSAAGIDEVAQKALALCRSRDPGEG
jgi:hypothetical protein